MASINLDGEPIFVDVAVDQQFPILYSHLLASQEDDTTIEAKPETSIEINEPASPATNETKQLQNESQLHQNNQIEATNACIKIEKRRLKCPECKRFTCETEEKMVRHIRKVHRGENPFQCYMCEYSTYNKAVFEEHVRVHQGIKPFQCSYCDYKSASKKNAKKHELRHRADNPLRCKDCGFIAKNSQSFRCHRNKEHPNKTENAGKVYSCKICTRNFSTLKKKTNHYKMRKKCTQCAYVTCTKMLFDTHLQLDHGVKCMKKETAKIFTCSLCPWSSNSKPRILLHLIHHPNQKVKEEVVDITVLRNCGIME